MILRGKTDVRVISVELSVQVRRRERPGMDAQVTGFGSLVSRAPWLRVVHPWMEGPPHALGQTVVYSEVSVDG